jgi:hypothetical protein
MTPSFGAVALLSFASSPPSSISGYVAEKGRNGFAVRVLFPSFPGPPFPGGVHELKNPTFVVISVRFRQVPCLGEVHLKIMRNNSVLFHASPC